MLRRTLLLVALPLLLPACAAGRVQFVQTVAPAASAPAAPARTPLTIAQALVAPAAPPAAAAPAPAHLQLFASTATNSPNVLTLAAPAPSAGPAITPAPATTFHAVLRAPVAAARGTAVWQQLTASQQLTVLAQNLPGLLAGEEWVVYGFTVEPYAAVRLGALTTDPVTQQTTFTQAFGRVTPRPERLVVKSQPVGTARFGVGATALEGVFSPQN